MPITLKKKVEIKRFIIPKPGLPKGANSEEEAKIELTEAQRLFREARSKASADKETVTNAAHYLVFTFGTAARQAEFLEKSGLDADTHFFVDGEKLAVAMGIALAPAAKLSGKKRRPLKACALISSCNPTE